MIIDFLNIYFDKNNITQCEIERRTNIARSKVNLILNKKRRLTAEELLKISIEFDINLEEIKKEIKNAGKQ